MWLVSAWLACTGGAALAQSAPGAAEDPLRAAMALIDERYPVDIDRGDLNRAAVQGIASYLDETLGTAGSEVLTTAEYDDWNAWLRGEREGIGAEFSIASGQGLVITDVFADGAAIAGGVRVGDLVVAMDDHPFTGLPASAIHALVLRSTSPKVTLDIRRGGDLKRIRVERGPYSVPTVQLMPAVQVNGRALPPIVRVKFFGEGAADDLAALMADVDGDAVVLDLRDCDGGLLEEAAGAAGVFLDPGSVFAYRVAPQGDREELAVERRPQWNGRVVLIVNQGTRGVAEAFAAALRDLGDTTLVGTPTGGDAGYPSYHPLGGDLMLKLVDFRLRSPTDRTWAGSGLLPDYRVQPPDLQLGGAVGRAPPDLQRDAALQLISSP